MEVEAVDEGVVAEILVAEGAEGVKVNTPIARLTGEGDAAPAPKPKRRSRRRTPRLKPKAEPAPEPKARQGRGAAKAAPAPAKADGERIFASPLARRLAEQKRRRPVERQGHGPARPHRQGATSRPRRPRRRRRRRRADRAPRRREPRQAQSPGADGHRARQLRPHPAGRHAQDHRAAADRQLPRRAALPADHRLRDRRPAGRAGAGSTRMLEKQGVKVSVNDFVIKAAAVALKARAGGQRQLHARGHRHAPPRRRRHGGGDRRRPDHPDHPQGRDQGPGRRSPRSPRTWPSGPATAS